MLPACRWLGYPHPGALVRYTDLDDHRFTAFAAGAAAGRSPDLELRHRRLARAAREQDVVGRLGGDEFVICCLRRVPLADGQ